MKKPLALLVAVFVLTTFLFAEDSGKNLAAVLKDGNNKNRAGAPVTFTIKEQDLFYNPETFLTGDNTQYNKDIAVLLSLFSADIYDNAVVDTSGNTKEEDNTALYKALGLQHVEETRIPNVTDVVISMDTLSYGDKERALVFVVVQGTNGTYAQWSSNFDIGAETAAFQKTATDSAYWKNKNNHRGFDIAANMVQEVLEKYLEKYISTPEKDTVLVFTGHSRGAAVAAILGSFYERNSFAKTYTYTFASPALSKDKALSASIKTVFNVINEDDLVPAMPLETWGFVQLGTKKTTSVADTFASSWALAVGKDSYLSGDAQTAKAKGGFFNYLAASREDIYAMGGASRNNYSIPLVDIRGNRLDVKAELDALTSYGLDRYSDLKVSPDGTRLEGIISPAFALDYLASVIAISKTKGALASLVFINKYSAGFSPEYKYFTSGFVGAATNGGMANSHAPSTYILLTQKMD